MKYFNVYEQHGGGLILLTRIQVKSNEDRFRVARKKVMVMWPVLHELVPDKHGHLEEVWRPPVREDDRAIH